MYVYKDSILLNAMGIVTFEDQPLLFHLKRFSSQKKGAREHNEYVVEAKRARDKKVLTLQLEKRLWEQLQKCRGTNNYLVVMVVNAFIARLLV